MQRIRVIMDVKAESSEVGILLKTLENQVKDFEATVKNIKRRLPQDGSQGRAVYYKFKTTLKIYF